MTPNDRGLAKVGWKDVVCSPVTPANVDDFEFEDNAIADDVSLAKMPGRMMKEHFTGQAPLLPNLLLVAGTLF